MSLYRLSIALHCWPTTRPERRRPDLAGVNRVEAARLNQSDEDRPVQRIPLYDQVLDGDDRRDLEYFDTRLAEGLVEAAGRLRAITRHRLEQLRDIGYATRVEVAVSAEPGEIDFELPAAFVRACGELDLPVQVTSDQLELVGSHHGQLFKEGLEAVEELKASDLF
jgi:hypothetical protein